MEGRGGAGTEEKEEGREGGGSEEKEEEGKEGRGGEAGAAEDKRRRVGRRGGEEEQTTRTGLPPKQEKTTGQIPTGRQQLGPDDWNLDAVAAGTHEFVEDEDDERSDEVPREKRVLNQAADAVQEGEHVDQRVEAVCEPEGREHLAARPLHCEHVHDEDERRDQDASQPRDGLEAPVEERRLAVRPATPQQDRIPGTGYR